MLIKITGKFVYSHSGYLFSLSSLNGPHMQVAGTFFRYSRENYVHWNKLELPHVNISKCDTSPAQTHQDVNQQRLCFSILSSWEEELLTKPSSLTLKHPEMFTSKLQDSGHSSETSGLHLLKHDCCFHRIFIQEQLDLAATRKRRLRRKTQPRHRFMITAAWLEVQFSPERNSTLARTQTTQPWG